MCVKFLYIGFILSAIRLNHAAEPQQKPSVPRISATRTQNQQVLQLASGSDLTLLKFFNLFDAAPGPCNGTCVATSHTERIDGENCKVDLENGIPEMNVLIKTAVSNSFVGIWNCLMKTPSAYKPGAMSLQSAVFRVFIKPPGLNVELPEKPSGSIQSVHVANWGTRNVTLEKGQPMELNITGKFNDYLHKSCILTCRIVEREPFSSHHCGIHDTNIFAVLNSTPAYSGLWNCTVELKQEQKPKPEQQNGNHHVIPIHFTLNITQTEKTVLGLSKDIIMIIAIAVSTIVVLIIIGQTICIIHFKKKAKIAQIDKNLTPKNTINEGSSTDRYVNKKSGKEQSGKGEVDEGIYEALESTRDEPPPVPPLATMPVTPKPQHLMRSASQSNLLDGAKTNTTPRPPRSHQSPGRFNTVARSSSLERIKNRPPQPLPNESDIYEDVAPDDVSPVIRNKLFGMKSTPPGPSTPMCQNQPVPGKPLPGFPIKPEFLKPPGPNAGRPPIANKFPTTKPMGGTPILPSVISGAKPMPVTSGPGGIPMGGMPVLPSMISAANANLKPVNKTKPNPPPPLTDRPRLPTPSSTSAKPYKPKPPVPLPEPVIQEPEPIPEDFESVVSDDSDDEFKCYDVLPDYNIYGNGAY